MGRAKWISSIGTSGAVASRGIGARIVVEAVIGGRTVRQTRVVTARTSWRSANSHVQHIGLADADEVESIEVRWPSGTVERFPGPLPLNRTVHLVERLR